MEETVNKLLFDLRCQGELLRCGQQLLILLVYRIYPMYLELM